MKFDIEEEETREKKKTKKSNKIYLYLVGFFLLVFLILLITYLILLSGNNTKKITPPAPTVVEEKNKITIYDEKSNDRPIAFMIDNNIGEAKHAGLQDSYLNYEIIVEGGLTRIMAIYKDKDVKLIGPIRSARHYFLDYAVESDAIYSHFGYSPQTKTDLKELNVDNIDGMTDSEPYRRDEKSKSPHNVFTNISYISSYLSKKNYSDETSNWKLLNISADEVSIKGSDNSATNISMTYSKNEYRSYSYDESNKYYLRSQNGSPHLDRLSGNQLHYKNIIIMKVENSTIDSYGRQTLNTTGSGSGYLITNGYYKKINWSKQTRISKTNYTYEDGSEIKINDGNTFIQIVPIDSEITIR